MLLNYRHSFLISYTILLVSSIDVNIKDAKNTTSAKDLNTIENNNANSNSNSNTCYIIKETLKCPQWKSSLISATWLNTKINSTTLSLENKLDQVIYNEIKQYKIQSNVTQCNIIEDSIQQILLPLICGRYFNDDNFSCNKGIDTNEKKKSRICKFECSNSKAKLEAILSENETCFDKDNKKLKEKLISYFNNDLCEEEMFEGERGQCLLLSNQADTSQHWHIDKTVLLGGGLALGVSISLLTIFLILRLRKKRYNRRLGPKIKPNNNNNNEKPTKETRETNTTNTSKTIAHSTFFARRSDEMHLNCGDLISIWREFDDLWCFGKNITTSQQGIFPKICLKKPSKPSGGSGMSMQLIIPVRTTSLALNQEFKLPSQRFFPEHNRTASDVSGCGEGGLSISHTYSNSLGNSIRGFDSYSSSIRKVKVSSNFPKLKLSGLNSSSSDMNLNFKQVQQQQQYNQQQQEDLIGYSGYFNTSENSLNNTPPPPVHSPPKPPEEL